MSKGQTLPTSIDAKCHCTQHYKFSLLVIQLMKNLTKLLKTAKSSYNKQALHKTNCSTLSEETIHAESLKQQLA